MSLRRVVTLLCLAAAASPLLLAAQPGPDAAFLQPKGRPDAAVRGTVSPHLREVKALAGVLQRNYDYDRFWVRFPLTGPGGNTLFSSSDQDAELVVRIYEKEGHVEWPIPASMRQGP